MSFRFGYNTNGFANHALPDAVEVVAASGYVGLGLTVDHAHCNPYTIDPVFLADLKVRLQKVNLSVVIETGARFLLDKWHKHEPTLISATGREKRIDFLKRCVDIGVQLDAEAVAFFSGVRQANVSETEAEAYFLQGCEQVLEYAASQNMAIGFEPEPGMFVDSMAKFRKIAGVLDHPGFKLTLDIGHLFCTEKPGSEADWIEALGPFIVNMHIEDIKSRAHFHLPFGEGDIDFAPIFRAIHTIDYKGLIQVELSRDSHRAPDAARQSMAFLAEAVRNKKQNTDRTATDGILRIKN